MNTLRKLALLFAIVAVFAVAGLVHAGELDQTETPAPTMRTLDEIYQRLDEVYDKVDKIPPSWSERLPVSERFVLVLGGAGVLDRETGLVWEQSPGTGTSNWEVSCYECYQKEVGGRTGWRLPTIEELMSIVDRSNLSSGPTLPTGHPFSNVQQDFYWSTSRQPLTAGWSYTVNFLNSLVTGSANSDNHYWWCVRGGPGHDVDIE
jgi:hypothetical protein